MPLLSYEDYLLEIEKEELFAHCWKHLFPQEPLADGSGLIDIRTIAVLSAPPRSIGGGMDDLPDLGGFSGSIAPAPVLMPAMIEKRPRWILPLIIISMCMLAIILVGIGALWLSWVRISILIALGLVALGLISQLIWMLLGRRQAKSKEYQPVAQPEHAIGSIIARRLGDVFSNRLLALGKLERALEERDDHVHLMGGHCIETEYALREIVFIPSLVLADAVISALDRSLADIIVKALGQNPLKPTLGLIEIWLIGLHRVLSRETIISRRWLDKTFIPKHNSGLLDPESILSSSEFVSFVSALRNKVRNPIMHGNPGTNFDRSAYCYWCTQTYGRQLIYNFLTEPLAISRMEGPGWIACLLAGSRAL
jgi:hypothetical protein